jgi:hypothetical protein
LFLISKELFGFQGNLQSSRAAQPRNKTQGFKTKIKLLVLSLVKFIMTKQAQLSKSLEFSPVLNSQNILKIFSYTQSSIVTRQINSPVLLSKIKNKLDHEHNLRNGNSLAHPPPRIELFIYKNLHFILHPSTATI